ncbi:hypothetical protein FRC11_010480 [Ceratobasidium sp. 423]|nr:hypothetical protein FRC11_010480 [Ceratobasidium sp. 423]
MDGINGDSPTRPKHTHSIEYRSLHVENSRKTLTQDIPEVPEVSLDSLMHAVLHDIPDSELERVCDKLLKAGCFTDVDSDNPRWRCLPLSPRIALKSEAVVFESLEKIAKDIAKYSGISRPIAHLRVAGQLTPLSDRRNTSRPDGFFHLGSVGPQRPNWANIVMPMEFKNMSSDASQTDDFEKVLWSMHHIMRNDPRRRYVHGLTCENTQVRLWFHDRSDVVASTKFDINKDWKYLVRIILSMLSATRVELGYDPTVRAVTSNDGNAEPSYNITIHNVDEGTNNVYRTVGILSDIGVDSMVCRASRVWEVKKLVNGVPGGDSYVLKDIWVHEDRIPEHEILQDIREAQPEYSDYFLTPLDHCFVPLVPSEPQTADSTHKTLGHSRDLKPTGKTLPTRIRTFSQLPSESKGSASTPRDSVGHPHDILNVRGEGGRKLVRLSKHARRHYRILFKEIGKPVHDLRNFTDVFIAIRGGWEGLHAMHLCGYVHRDVSSGNILLVDPQGNKRGVIMDLEYAKKIDDMSEPHDVKTGTAAFMATEVAFTEHHRLESLRSKRQTNPSREAMELWGKSDRKADAPSSSELPPLPPFRHNPLHDMESVWWLCVWIMFYLSCSKKKRLEQYENSRQVFGSQHTKEKFSEPRKFGPLTTHLSETPKMASEIKSWLLMLNCHYTDCYEKQDSWTDPPTILRIDDATIEESYTFGQKTLQTLEEASKSLPKCVTLPERFEQKNPTSGKSPLILDCVLLPPPPKKRRYVITLRSGSAMQ